MESSLLVMMVVMIVALYFTTIRPDQKRQKAIQQLQQSLKVGDEVITRGGITGTICAVKENAVVVESGADRVRIEMARWAVDSRATPEEKKPASGSNRTSVELTKTQEGK